MLMLEDQSYGGELEFSARACPLRTERAWLSPQLKGPCWERSLAWDFGGQSRQNGGISYILIFKAAAPMPRVSNLGFPRCSRTTILISPSQHGQ